jgi:hypothetical protein
MTDQTRTEAGEAGIRPLARNWRARLRGRRRRPDPGQVTTAPDAESGGPAPAAGLASVAAAPARGRRATIAGSVTGLCLGLLAVGPGLLPGYLLSYDMVFVPSPPFNGAVLGTSGTLPRAVPSDAAVATLARLLPADAVQKIVLLAIFVLACAGVARLLAREPLPAQLLAGVFYAWNPFVAERLIIGQWATLLGYAGLPWVLAAVAGPARGLAGRARLVVAVVPAAIGGFAAMLISGLTAVPVAAARPAGEPRLGPSGRLARVGLVLAVLGVLSLPWLIPALARPVATSTAGVGLFAARADTPFGTLGSLLMLGGLWNAQTTPAGYGGLASVAWFALAVAALAGFVLLGRRRWPGLPVAAAAGLLVALLGAFGPGQALLRGLIGWWPGFAVVRDGQQFIAPLALAEALGLGLVTARLLAAGRTRPHRESLTAAALVLVVLPVLFLPGLAWGAAGRLRPVSYPAAWAQARRVINAGPRPGDALLLPWSAYRRYDWNHGEAVLDPWPRLLDRDVIWNDGVQVGSVALPPEDPAAVALNGAIRSGRPLTGLLRLAGIRYVIVDAGFGPGPAGSQPFRSRLAGCRVVVSGPGLRVYQVPPR